METTNIHEAKTHFSRLVDRAAEGEHIIIAKAGKPVAKLVPYRRIKKKKQTFPKRKPGGCEGMWIADDFDAPMPEEIMKYFLGELP